MIVSSGDQMRYYDLGPAKNLETLRRDYESLYARYGGLKPALYAIASMLDIPGVAREGVNLEAVEKLIEVAGLL